MVRRWASDERVSIRTNCFLVSTIASFTITPNEGVIDERNLNFLASAAILYTLLLICMARVAYYVGCYGSHITFGARRITYAVRITYSASAMLAN